MSQKKPIPGKIHAVVSQLDYFVQCAHEGCDCMALVGTSKQCMNLPAAKRKALKESALPNHQIYQWELRGGRWFCPEH